MFQGALKTKIALNLAVLMLVSMCLIEFVSIVIAQNDLIHALTERGENILFAVSQFEEIQQEKKNLSTNSAFQQKVEKLLKNAEAISAGFLDNRGDSAIIGENDKEISRLLKHEMLESLLQRSNTKTFFGSTWGIYWTQKKYVCLCTSIDKGSQIRQALGIVFSLESIYSDIRNKNHLFLLYILANGAILTGLGVGRLSTLLINPLNRLVDRVEEYREDEGLFFMSAREDNEFYRLSKSIRSMISRFASNKEELKNAVASLEKANQELKKAQRDIIRAEKLATIGRLTSGIAHEVGNPIGIVLGYLELLKQMDIPREEKEEFILRAEKEIHRIQTILRQLLDFSRANNGDKRTVPIHSLLNEMVEMIKFQPLFTDIHIELQFTAGNVTLYTDQDQLRQVFLNLMINAADAIKSVGKKGKITIFTRTSLSQSGNSGDMFDIVFQDNGPGIPEELIDFIFDPFFTTKDPGKGTGLGLFVSFMITEKMGGVMRAANNRNGGADFTMTIPVDQSKEPLKLNP